MNMLIAAALSASGTVILMQMRYGERMARLEAKVDSLISAQQQRRAEFS